jgi:hypothetical protein
MDPHAKQKPNISRSVSDGDVLTMAGSVQPLEQVQDVDSQAPPIVLISSTGSVAADVVDKQDKLEGTEGKLEDKMDIGNEEPIDAIKSMTDVASTSPKIEVFLHDNTASESEATKSKSTLSKVTSLPAIINLSSSVGLYSRTAKSGTESSGRTMVVETQAMPVSSTMQTDQSSMKAKKASDVVKANRKPKKRKSRVQVGANGKEKVETS